MRKVFLTLAVFFFSMSVGLAQTSFEYTNKMNELSELIKNPKYDLLEKQINDEISRHPNEVSKTSEDLLQRFNFFFLTSELEPNLHPVNEDVKFLIINTSRLSEQSEFETQNQKIDKREVFKNTLLASRVYNTVFLRDDFYKKIQKKDGILWAILAHEISHGRLDNYKLLVIQDMNEKKEISSQDAAILRLRQELYADESAINFCITNNKDIRILIKSLEFVEQNVSPGAILALELRIANIRSKMKSWESMAKK